MFLVGMGAALDVDLALVVLELNAAEPKVAESSSSSDRSASGAVCSTGIVGGTWGVIVAWNAGEGREQKTRKHAHTDVAAPAVSHTMASGRYALSTEPMLCSSEAWASATCPAGNSVPSLGYKLARVCRRSLACRGARGVHVQSVCVKEACKVVAAVQAQSRSTHIAEHASQRVVSDIDCHDVCTGLQQRAHDVCSTTSQ